MFGIETINLPLEKRGVFFYEKNKIEKLSREVNDLFSKAKFVNDSDLRKILMIPENLRIVDDLDVYDIDKVHDFINNNSIESLRLFNIYLGYIFIFSNDDINRDSLKNLYNIISHNIVNYDNDDMGYYYRKSREFIVRRNFKFSEYQEQISPENIDGMMDSLLKYINENSDIDAFIKSQIIKLYLVYVHPFFDTNGRCSRMLSSWFLVKNNMSKYLLFNKVINNDKSSYLNVVEKSIRTKNFTYYLSFILDGLKKEINNLNIIYDLNTNTNLSIEEKQILEIILSMNEDTTIDRVILKYNNFDPHITKNREHILSIIYSLIEKNIINEKDGLLLVNYNVKGESYGSRKDR